MQNMEGEDRSFLPNGYTRDYIDMAIHITVRKKRITISKDKDKDYNPKIQKIILCC